MSTERMQNMGRHKLWRAQVKKIRRKRLRQKRAQERDALLQEERRRQEMSPTYQAWIAEQDIIEKFREEEEERLSIERHKEWERIEIEAQHEWCLRKLRAEKAKKEREEQELRIRKEWEEEQEKIRLQEEEKSKEKQEKQKRQEELMKEIIDFVEKGGERPAFASDVSESNPNMPLCPFFSKTGACRFGDRCSRNHPRPALSTVVLLPNFYSHFGMDQSMLDEYDTDLMLEYEDSETYQHFREFYEDVVPELYRYGQPVAVVICSNAEPHLRGNVYVEYAREAEAAKAVTSLNGRWYGGKLISAQFTNIPSWKSAICGLFPRGRCPKGKACNFLHIFRNPGGEFSYPDREREKVARRRRMQEDRSECREGDFSERYERSSHRQEDGRRGSQRSKREWRWSESPERTLYPTVNEGEERSSGRDRDEERKKPRRERGREEEEDDKKKRSRGDDVRERHSSRMLSRSKETRRKREERSSRERSSDCSHRSKHKEKRERERRRSKKSEREKAKENREASVVNESENVPDTKDSLESDQEMSESNHYQKTSSHKVLDSREVLTISPATPNCD